MRFLGIEPPPPQEDRTRLFKCPFCGTQRATIHSDGNIFFCCSSHCHCDRAGLDSVAFTAKHRNITRKEAFAALIQAGLLTTSRRTPAP